MPPLKDLILGSAKGYAVQGGSNTPKPPTGTGTGTGETGPRRRAARVPARLGCMFAEILQARSCAAVRVGMPGAQISSFAVPFPAALSTIEPCCGTDRPSPNHCRPLGESPREVVEGLARSLPFRHFFRPQPRLHCSSWPAAAAPFPVAAWREAEYTCTCTWWRTYIRMVVVV